ncbi:NADH-quinone oxidoreductase subunit K [Cereibacter sphaeroides]|uniref:NADH-quinone oxidoreductase subunit NuoK n=1 Tax=Rhodobacterales TaxID=204455 RepID=UPI000BBEF60B|nr:MULTISPECIES: NADH-quinone oxidoreductase subunit K [Paracoccaceae]MCE6953039.1 NADH-quinone oxidoreductase subunit K [Cereibacter sphaeroides]MCE6961862.1 NADH-quinone oxidoreductase subunit K [Cereibacter sphaeroides]MCE6970637.1 NADH-quinone oxidoreductase subunit K [Cereibacter sphaeroides]MCE6975767.1 NADH-quinone oxidoreductase subunit K [Cereibacter sphaeroides]
MSATTLSLLLILAGGLFVTGFFGLLARRAILFQLISLELMLAGPALAFLAGGAFHGSQQGQGMFVLIVILAAAEVALGLALYLALGRVADVEDSDTITRLRH